MQKYRFQASRTKFHSIVSIRKSNSINKKVPTDYFRRKIFFHFQNPRNESKLFQCSEFKILLISFEKEDPCKYYRIRELFVDAKGLETFCGWLHCTFGLIMPWISRRTTLRTERERDRDRWRKKENKPYLYLDKRYPGRCNYKLREIPRNSL